MRVIGDSSEDATVACFLLGELTSRRFGAGIRRALVAAGESERLLMDADLADPAANLNEPPPSRRVGPGEA